MLGLGSRSRDLQSRLHQSRLRMRTESAEECQKSHLREDKRILTSLVLACSILTFFPVMT